MELKIDKNFINNRDTNEFSWRKAWCIIAALTFVGYAWFLVPFGIVIDIPIVIGGIVGGIILSYFGKRAFTGVSEAVGNFVKSKTKT